MNGNQIAVTALGAGYDTFTGSACPSALGASSGQTTTAPVGTSMEVHVCTSYASVCNALRMSEGFTVATVFQENAPASSSVTMTTTSVAVVIRAARSATMTYGTSPAMATSAPSTAKEAQAFFQQYGDSYVSSVDLGGVYVAVYVFYCQNADEQQSLQASLSPMDGELNAETATALAAALKNSLTSWTCHQQALGGGNLTLPRSTDAAALVAFALAFPEKSTQATPVVLAFATTGYETLAGFQGTATQAAFAPVVANRATFTTTVTPAALALIGVLNQISAIRDVYTAYGGFDDTVLGANGAAIASSLQLLKDWVRAVDSNATSNPMNAADVQQINTALAYGSPVLRYRTSTPQSFGAMGGAPFTDIRVNDVDPTNLTSSTPIPILQLPALVSIQLFGSSALGEMKCTYTTNSPPQTCSFTHGSTNNSGGWGAMLYLQPNEFITNINGSATNYVTRLSFVTSLGQTMTFPPGMGSGREFQWAVPSGFTLVGFQGSSAWDLNQLIPILISFEPASWTPTPTAPIPLLTGSMSPSTPSESSSTPSESSSTPSGSSSTAPITVIIGPTTSLAQAEYLNITVTGSTISVTSTRGPGGAIPNQGSGVVGTN